MKHWKTIESYTTPSGPCLIEVRPVAKVLPLSKRSRMQSGSKVVSTTSQKDASPEPRQHTNKQANKQNN
jgi:hypothetical protein